MLSLFKVGIIIALIGIAWTAIEFYQADKISQDFELKSEKTETVQVELEGTDIGFYKISVPKLGDEVLVRVFDTKSNIIEDKRISTKSSVNYFEFEDSGYYILQVTNLASHDFEVGIEFGDTNASEMKYSGLMTVIGVILVVIAAYQRLRYDHKIAQPDENI